MRTDPSNIQTLLDGWGDDILLFFDEDEKFSGCTKGWPLTEFRTVFTIAVGYVALTIIGATLMKVSNIPPINPYPIKFFYNVSQIFLCAYISVEALMIAYRNSYTFCCNSYNQKEPAVATLMWLFYITKMWDFWDTIFIILGKKWRQLSFLHVYHHFSVLLICWLQLNVLYDGDTFLFIFLNGFVHTVMYTYYFICMHTKIPGGGGKSLPIWWKSSLTIAQMVQFVTLMISGVYTYLNDCQGYNYRVSSLCCWYTATLLGLFASFFSISYLSASKKKGKKAKSS
jgi:elongation of very long chain fatty acids protein 4